MKHTPDNYIIHKLPHAIGPMFFVIIGVTWFCEKLGIGVRLSQRFADERKRITLFENLPVNKRDEYSKGYDNKLFDFFVKGIIPSEYGNKVISQIGIRQEIQQKADKWASSNLQGDFIGVHYRGTDVKHLKRHKSLEDYIAYLKKVLCQHSTIYACSDLAQFIEQMHDTFPDRVFSTDITRSRNKLAIHKPTSIARMKRSRAEQQEEALLDLLILSKASLIYTTGSNFADLTRFLNPAIKIISLDGRAVNYKSIPNYVPTPKLPNENIPV